MEEPTANRPPAAATGTLGKTPWLHLLVYALGKKLSGTIELAAPDGAGAAVFFGEGEPVRARMSARGLQGKQSEGDDLGRKLRQIGAMPASTEYAYYAGFDAFGGGPGKGVDPIPLLWGVLREHPPADHVVAGIARLGHSGVKLAAMADPKRLALPTAEAQAVECLRGRSLTTAGLAGAAGLEEGTAQLLVYLLLLTKQVDIAAPSEPIATRAPAPPASVPRLRPGSSASLPAITPPPTLGVDLAQRWREVLERATSIDRADYFTMLDLAREATRDEVESAYFALAKRWHPDRLPPELSPIKDACARVFARMSEAHATLVEDEKRKQYMRLLADGSGSPEMQETVAKVVEAATNFQKAEVFFKRSDLAQAEAFCRKAVEADATQADYHAFLAWLVALKPENQSPEKTAECVLMLDRAIAISNRCERAYFWRGTLYKRLGKNDVAFVDFRRAAELNPRNIDAAREVRLYQKRTGQLSGSMAPPPQSGPPPGGAEDAGKPPARPSLLNWIFKPPPK